MHRIFDYQREDPIDVSQRILASIQRAVGTSTQVDLRQFQTQESTLSQVVSVPTAKKVEAVDPGSIAPSQDFELSQVAKPISPRSSGWQRALLLLLLTFFLAVLAAYWAHQWLVGDIQQP